MPRREPLRPDGALRRLRCAAIALLLVVGAPAGAADLVLWSAGAMKSSVEAILAQRDPALPSIDVTYAPAGTLRERLRKGEAPDVVILPSGDVYDLMMKKGIDVATRRPLGETGVGVAVRAGAPLPDISTPDALKATLLAARKVVIVDPAKGTSGKLVETLFHDLRIVDAMKEKTTKVDGGYVVEAVARGEADLGLHQISEILPVAGVVLVGPLPLDLQRNTRYDTAVLVGTTHASDAKALVEFLASDASRSIIEANGFRRSR